MEFEVCVDCPDGVLIAAQGGADRVELCSALGVGGLTPSPGLMAFAAGSDLPAHAMIRPRAGGFVLSDEDEAVMAEDIKAARRAGLAGIVLGALTAHGALDVVRLQRLIAMAGPLEVTLHRAIDVMADPVDGVRRARALGFSRILTSGGKPCAFDGRPEIARMVAATEGQIEIMAGSGLGPAGLDEFVAQTGVAAVHASCSRTRPEANARVDGLGFGPTRQTDLGAVLAMRQAIDRIGGVSKG